MRLLHTTKLRLEEFWGGNIPPYAILSHIWGEDEVSFQQITTDVGNQHRGYEKITSACTLAASDEFDYIWIDTCCIDRSSSAELSEAINSMFRWYKESNTCYVYLADVKVPSSSNNYNGIGLLEQISGSRWFTRGWTLQELIAPSNVVFLDVTWELLGTKSSLQSEISDLTGIPESILQGSDLASASVAQRMSWASQRMTTRVEDIAYCLMGLFGVNMPMLYGEGDNAFIRLQNEILKVSDDHSIFAWKSDDARGGLLATSPASFRMSSKFIPSKSFSKSSFSTNRGIRLNVRFVDTKNSQAVRLAVVSCAEEGKSGNFVGIYLKESPAFDKGCFVRTRSDRLRLVNLKKVRRSEYPEQTIFVQREHNVGSVLGNKKTLSRISEQLGDDYDSGSDIASIFSDGRTSTSSVSTANLNHFQTTGVREVARALLSQDMLKSLYITAVCNLERRKARVHIRGFLKEYGRNLLKEAFAVSLQVQAAKFVQELAGHIADEISWSITGFENVNRPPEIKSEHKDLETWLSSVRVQSGHAEESVAPDFAVNVDEVFEQEQSDEELDGGLQFPNIDKVKDFLLRSKAFGTLVAAMRTWLKVEVRSSSGEPRPALPGILNNQDQKVDKAPENLVISGSFRQHTKDMENLATEASINLRQNSIHVADTRSIPRQSRGSVSDFFFSLLDYQGISFYLYDFVELFVPLVRPGFKRLRWRCSCDVILWGDFPVDEEPALDLLKRELSWQKVPFTQNVAGRGPLSRPNVDSKPGGSATIPLEPIGPFAPSIQPKFLQPRGLSSLNRASVSGSFLSTQSHIVHVTTSPKFFEVCINIGNFAIEHHEVDISHVSSDSELFALIWDKYNSSRGIGLRRLFLRPRNVDFVMFSVSRGVKYGTGIHKKPDEFPPPTEIEKKRYHYLHPKIRMPVNVFLHYLHRARWNIFGEHAETTWLRRLPKKLNESILTQALPYDAANQNDQQEVPMTDPNLAFGWGVHIIDGPNHAVLGVLLAISIGVAFLVSGLIVGFAKTQEQGFGVGSFLLTIFASIMAAMYFQLQDQ